MTGATGFIGSAILGELVNSGRRVTVLLRKESDTSRLKNARGYERLEYASLLDDSTVEELSRRKPDVFIHCAWKGVGGGERNEAFQVSENVPAAIKSTDLAARTGCRQWIGLGSQAEYGNQNRRLDEDAPLKPTTVYGKAKLSAGIAALALCEARQMAGAWLRVFSTYGPNDAPNWFIPYVIREFLSGNSPRLTKCEQLWDYLFVGDAAKAVAAAANGSLSGVYNLGSGTARPLKDYIEAIRGGLNSAIVPSYGAIPYREDQVMHLEADISRLKTATGWQPEKGIEDGLRETIDFERSRPASLKK